MLFDVQLSTEILNAYVVHHQIVIQRGSPNTVEDVLRMQSAGHSVHHHVHVLENAVNRLAHFGDDPLGALESYGPGEPDGEVGEVSVPCLTNTDAIDFQNAGNTCDSIYDLGSNTGGSSVEQSVDGLPSEAPAHVDDNSCDYERRDRVSLDQPGFLERTSRPDNSEAQDYDTAGPDVCAEVQRIGMERLAVVTIGDALECARTPGVNHDGNEHYNKGPDTGLYVHCLQPE